MKATPDSCVGLADHAVVPVVYRRGHAKHDRPGVNAILDHVDHGGHTAQLHRINDLGDSMGNGCGQ